MKNKQIKMTQRMINKVFRNINKMIEIDPLWKGRFYVIQRDRRVITYEDGFVELVVIYDLVDKQTLQTQTMRERGVHRSVMGERFFGNHVAMAMNDFIIIECDVWAERPTRETTKDYRKVAKI